MLFTIVLHRRRNSTPTEIFMQINETLSIVWMCHVTLCHFQVFFPGFICESLCFVRFVALYKRKNLAAFSEQKISFAKGVCCIWMMLPTEWMRIIDEHEPSYLSCSYFSVLGCLYLTDTDTSCTACHDDDLFVCSDSGDCDTNLTRIIIESQYVARARWM